MTLYMSSNTTLWKAVVALELSRAVLESNKNAHVSIVDHYTQAEQFMEHLSAEYQERGGCPADWVWIVPPQSGLLVLMLRYKLSPSYEYQQTPWMAFKSRSKIKFKTVAWTVLLIKSIYSKLIKERKKVTILYGSEPGQSKRFANQAMDIFMYNFKCVILPLDAEEVFNQIKDSNLTIFICSTFGNGEAPCTIAKAFNLELKRLLLANLDTTSKHWYNDMNFAVLVLRHTWF